MPEEVISTGKVRLLGMTGRVENVPLPPSLTHLRHHQLDYALTHNRNTIAHGMPRRGFYAEFA